MSLGMTTRDEVTSLECYHNSVKESGFLEWSFVDHLPKFLSKTREC